MSGNPYPVGRGDARDRAARRTARSPRRRLPVWQGPRWSMEPFCVTGALANCKDTPTVPWCAGYSPYRGTASSRLGDRRGDLPDTENCVEEQAGLTPQGVEEDRSDADRHRRHRPDRVYQASGGQRHPHAVEQYGERDVLKHLPVAPPADLARLDSRLEPIVENDDVGRVDGDVSPPSHPDPDVRLHESGRVVDSISDHRHIALALQFTNQPRLVLGKQFCVDVIHSQLIAHPARCPGVVTTQDEGTQAHRLEARYHTGRIRTNAVPEREKTQQAIVPRNADDRAAGGLEQPDTLRGAIERHALLHEEPRTADEDFLAAYVSANAASRHGLEVAQFERRDFPFHRSRHHRGGKRMFRGRFG